MSDVIIASMEAALGESVHRVRAVQVIARGICGSSGPKPGCFCRGDVARCHARTLYEDYAVAAVLALQKDGIVLLPMPKAEKAA